MAQPKQPAQPKAAAAPQSRARPAGHAPGADGRPRAQVSFEGEDEFSAMSLDPARRKKPSIDIEGSDPGRSRQEIDDLKPKKRGMVDFLRKIFAK